MNFYCGKPHHVDLGFGQTISSVIYLDYQTIGKKRSYNLQSNISVGYRYQKSSDGLFFNINYTPILEFHETYMHWGSVSFGYAF